MRLGSMVVRTRRSEEGGDGRADRQPGHLRRADRSPQPGWPVTGLGPASRLGAWVVRDVGPLPGDRWRAFTGQVFVGHQAFLNVGFGVARARLTNLVNSGLLVSVAHDVYAAAVTHLAQASPAGPAELSKLVRVQARDVVTGAGSATLALRWQASAPDGTLFPALDADIRLAPAEDGAAVLTLDGAYRPPPEVAGIGLDQTVLHQAATAAVQDFLDRIAEAIAGGDSAPPGKPGAAPPRDGAGHTAPELSRRPATGLP